MKLFWYSVRCFLLLSAAALAPILLFGGCGLIFAERLLDKATESMERMAEMQAKIERERRAEVNYIEGEIAKVATVERDIEVQEPVTTVENSGTSIEFETKVVKKKVFVVHFSDGREKEFTQPSEKPLNPGQYCRIRYNGLGEITEVTTVN